MRKIAQFRQDLKDNKPVYYKLIEDVTLFANYYFQDPLDSSKSLVPFAWQDAVFQDKSKRVVCCTSRQIGKSTGAALEALHFAYWNDDATILVVSKTYPQSLEFIDRIQRLLSNSSRIEWEPLKPSEKESRASIKIKNAGKKTFSRILSLPPTEAALGYSADFVICDEAAFWEGISEGKGGDYIFDQVVMPTTFAKNGKSLALSTPNGRQGFFHRIYESPVWSAFNFDWRANPFKTDKDFEEMTDGLTQMQIDSNYNAKFVSPLNAYFTADEIEAAVKAHTVIEPKRTGKVIACDLGKIHDQAVILVGVLEKPTKDVKDAVVRVEKRIVKPLGTNYAAIMSEIKQLHKSEKAGKIMIDATGAGEGPSEFLRSEGLPVEAVKFSLQKKSMIYSTLKVLFEQKRIKIPDEAQMKSQLAGMMYEYTSSDAIKIFPHGSSHDDECFVAGTLVLTSKGNVPIESVKVGDLVVTRKGLRPVVCVSKRTARVISRFGLTGTPNHPFITKEGITKFINVKASDQLYIWNGKQSRIEERRITDTLPLPEGNSECISGAIPNGKPRLKRYIGNFGKTIMGQYRRIASSITKTGILLTIHWKILNAWKGALTPNFTPVTQSIGESPVETSNWPELKLLNGISQPKDVLGTRSTTTNTRSLFTKSVTSIPVLSAGSFTGQQSGQASSVTIQDADSDGTKETVYNLKVDGCPEYFANNILVHNCDALALLAYGLVGYRRVNVSVISASKKVSTKLYDQVCSEELGGCGEYFRTNKAERHFEKGLKCPKCANTLNKLVETSV